MTELPQYRNILAKLEMTCLSLVSLMRCTSQVMLQSLSQVQEIQSFNWLMMPKRDSQIRLWGYNLELLFTAQSTLQNNV